MKQAILFLLFISLLSCSGKKVLPKAELIIGTQPTAADFHQLYDWFESLLLILNDDPLEPEAEAFLNQKINPLWGNNAYVYLWGINVISDDPYASGLEIAHLVKQADEKFQYEKVPYDYSFLDRYEYIEIPDGDFLCKSTDVGCLDSLFSTEFEIKKLISKHKLFSERYLIFLGYPFMEEVSLKRLESPIPSYKYLMIGQRIYHLYLYEQMISGEDVISDVMNELNQIRLKLTQGTSLISKMIFHRLASSNIDLLNYLIQRNSENLKHPKLTAGVTRLTKSEISTQGVLKLEHQSGLRLFKEFLGDVELMISDKSRKPYVIPIMRVIRLILAKPNMTVNAHYSSVIKPLLNFTELKANEFFEKYHSTKITSEQNCLRNYLSCVLLESMGDFKSMYLSYQGRMYSLDMKIQLLNAYVEEGSFDDIVEKAIIEGVYLNIYDNDIPFISDNQICYTGIFESNDTDRCLEVHQELISDVVPVIHITRD